MLTFAAITPHPPIIIPTIGKKEDLILVKNTIEAMEKLRVVFEKSNTETLLIVSPHAPMSFHQLTFLENENFIGNFLVFGDFQTQLSFKNDIELLKEIKETFKKENIAYETQKVEILDHGTLVPLFYLTKNKKPEIIPFSYSMLDLNSNFNYGKILGKTIKKSEKKIGFVASGDLSHRLTPDAPAGYSPLGKKFDKTLIEFLKNKEVDNILNLDSDFVEEAGECGLRSIVILLGVLSVFDISNLKFRILSYEGPFGVGYLVAKIEGL